MTNSYSRLPLKDEPIDLQGERQQDRCDMTADTEDMRLAAEGTDDGMTWAIVASRALRADVQPRLAVVKTYDLNEWNFARFAIRDIMFGLPISENMQQLIGMLPKATLLSDAQLILEVYTKMVFSLEEEGYYTQKVAEALQMALQMNNPSKSDRKVAIQNVAKLAGLYAQSGEYEYNPEEGYYRWRDCWNLERVLTLGWALFKGNSISVLLYWAKHAKKGKLTPLPKPLSPESIATWAFDVLKASKEQDGDNAPSAWVEVDGTKITDLDTEILPEDEMKLCWKQVRSGSRFQSIVLVLTFENNRVFGKLLWDSGGKHPSSVLSIEALLGSKECNNFGILMEPITLANV